jgi:alpha-tubulin suppressor-like RCC1 family protein
VQISEDSSMGNTESEGGDDGAPVRAIAGSRRGRSGVGRGLLLAAAVGLLATLLGAGPVAGAGTVIDGGMGWGNNQTGEVGDGTTVNRLAPVLSIGLAGTSAMSAGSVHNLAITSSGGVVAWGHNHSGELGDGTTTDRLSPVPVTGLAGMVAVSAGTSFSLGVRGDGAVFAWGNNASGELGDGHRPTDQLVPVPVVGLGPGSNVVGIATGGAHALALKADGTVLAWGNNAVGELGDGSAPTDHPTPVPVSGLGVGSGVVAVSAGSAFSMALKSDGTVLAWGNNSSGELGDGSAPTSHVTPVQVAGFGPGSGVTQISAGFAFGLALKSNGQVFAWGNNKSGEVGDGSAPTDRSTPVAVLAVVGAVQISAGRAHAMALGANGTVWAWGDNKLGQIGDGTQVSAHTPVSITAFGGHHVVAVSAGGDHSHVLTGFADTPPPTGGRSTQQQNTPTAETMPGAPKATAVPGTPGLTG